MVKGALVAVLALGCYVVLRGVIRQAMVEIDEACRWSR